jgi:4-hydroxybenzoate polyprenyltransferase
MESTLHQTSFTKKLRYSLELIKFSHTLFALPFALAALLVTSRRDFQWKTLFWVIFCMVWARTAAMAFNRLVDAKIDSENPRTANRHLPQGLLSRRFVILLTLFSSASFIFGASQLNHLTLLLSPFALILLFFYSFTKRFTHFTQIFLGMSLGAAPIGATVAVTGHFTLGGFLLGMAVLFWVAGFDLLYALQDMEFDRAKNLYSLPVNLGVSKTFKVSTLFHVLFLILLLAYGKVEGLGTFYWMGLCLTGILLLWQHWILKENLSKIQAAFFTANGLLSVLFLIVVLVDIFI